MKPLTREEIVSNEEYERIRPQFRREIMRMKKDRVVAVGEHVTFHFESRETMRYQVQEMMRAEGMEREEQIQDEIDAYNPVIPGKNELSVTMMFEYETPEEREKYLPLLLNIEEHVFLQIGDTQPIKAEFDAAQISTDRISSVQYTKFHLTDEQAALLKREGTVVRAIMTHPHYRAQTVLGENTRKAIADDPS